MQSPRAYLCAGAAIAALSLAGCEVTPDGDLVPNRGFLAGFNSPGSEGGNAALAQPDASRALVEAVEIAGGDVIVAGPFGYCVDPTTVKSGRSRGFVVLASCNILSNGAAGSAVPPALITVTVGPKEQRVAQPDAATLAQLAEAPLLEARDQDGLALAYLGTGGDALFDGGDPSYWRGAFLLGNRLIGLAIYAPAESGIEDRDGARLLQETFAKIRDASPDPARPVSAGGGEGSNG
ncbi:hypothetical protein FIU97_16930 [Roseivivax sp. THAF40]|uniref:dihydroxy-acid dehydratase n=1 Tax=unclassified Roseivivax TaxID=2639302 RepID=UPI001267D2BA|nr:MULTISPECIES: dihydroxy-acid dehydratase [unclassified Roseivivax]QFS84442.1 hypothetical protein FIV09_16515 [Roseivivax sp. THAF197b]QFT48270.1 hypothetical protein FIU97_16930 [Roseivivax sp. THAF40]